MSRKPSEALATREPEVMDEQESIPVPAGGVGMTGLARAEVDVQIETAKRYPRSIKAALDYALQLATLDVETAEACFYVLPRGGKTIEGPGVRLAEIIASAWGNLRYGAEILGADDVFVRARGYCFDLQTNTAYAGEVERRITDSKGRRYNDDMIGVTGMAASAVASRNAVFKIVPRVYVNRIYEAAKKVARGTDKTIAQRRQTLFEKYAKRGITPAQIYAKLEVKGEPDITIEHIEMLAGLATAIHDGLTTLDKEFPPIQANGGTEKAAPAAQQKSAVEKLNDLAKKAAGKKDEPLPPPDTGEVREPGTDDDDPTLSEAG